MKYGVYTQSRRYYIVDEKNRIIRTDMKFTPSESWRCAGFCMAKPFGRFGGLESIEAVAGKEMRYKNGKGKYFLVDYDHGTPRMWSDRIIGVSKI